MAAKETPTLEELEQILNSGRGPGYTIAQNGELIPKDDAVEIDQLRATIAKHEQAMRNLNSELTNLRSYLYRTEHTRDEAETKIKQLQDGLDEAGSRLGQAIEAISSLPQEALGFGRADAHTRYPLRDELLSALESVEETVHALLADKPQDLKEKTMCESTEIKRLETERDNWIETARYHEKNEKFYRDLIHKIGEPFGTAAKTSNDGSVQEDVLALKVPKLVEDLRYELAEFLRYVNDTPEPHIIVPEGHLRKARDLLADKQDPRRKRDKR